MCFFNLQMSRIGSLIPLSAIEKTTKFRAVEVRVLHTWVQKDRFGKETMEVLLMDKQVHLLWLMKLYSSYFLRDRKMLSVFLIFRDFPANIILFFSTCTSFTTDCIYALKINKYFHVIFNTNVEIGTFHMLLASLL